VAVDRAIADANNGDPGTGVMSRAAPTPVRQAQPTQTAEQPHKLMASAP
jgi:hypothetical protein